MSSDLTTRKIGLWRYLDFGKRVKFKGNAEVLVRELPTNLANIVHAFDKAGISLFYLHTLEKTGGPVSALIDDGELPLTKLNELDRLLKQDGLSVDYIVVNPETKDWLEIVFKTG